MQALQRPVAPAFDLSNASLGRHLDLTAAVQALFDRAHANANPSFARMTVAQRKAALTPTDLRSAFYTDTPQDPLRGTATIDLSQGLVAPSSRTNETVGETGDKKPVRLVNMQTVGDGIGILTYEVVPAAERASDGASLQDRREAALRQAGIRESA